MPVFTLKDDLYIMNATGYASIVPLQPGKAPFVNFHPIYNKASL